MLPRNLKLVGVLAAVLTTGACDAWYNAPSPDDLWHRVAWFDHMIISKAVNPYSRVDVPRYTPKSAVPAKGGELHFGLGDPLLLQYGFDTVVANRLKNPTIAGNGGVMPVSAVEKAAIPASLEARGDTLYSTYCAMCHGYTGAANGTISARIGAPSLLTVRARGYADGYLYGMVRYGRGVMGQYGDKIVDPEGRWAVVNHVRKLQAAAPLEATVGGES